MKYFISCVIFSFIISLNAYTQLPAQTIPAFQFLREDKTMFTNKNLPKGKMLFFIFFDSECDHCRQAIKTINKEYKAFKKTAVYIISLDDHQKIYSFINKYGPGLKVQKNIVFLQDKYNLFVTKFTPRKYPSMFLYSEKSKLLQYEDSPENMFKFLNILKKKGK